MSSTSYFRQNSFCTLEFYCLLILSVWGMLLLTMARELITVFISLEIFSLCIYVLVGYNRRSATSAEAVLKYLMLGAFAGSFFTMGTALVYGAVRSTGFAAIASFIAEKGFLETPALVGGVFFILFAFLFKIAAFPFHAWVVDVYDGASVPVTGFMATALKTAIFAVLVNFLSLDAGLKGAWLDALFYITVFTLFAGNLIAIGQSNLKRMLAASGIVHTGYLLIAVIAVGDNVLSGNIILFYLAAYAASTLGIFASLSYLGGQDEKRNSFDDFKGLAKVRPVFGCGHYRLSPVHGRHTSYRRLHGQILIITTAFQSGAGFAAVLGIVSSILSMWYYLRLIIAMYFHEANATFRVSEASPFAPICVR